MWRSDIENIFGQFYHVSDTPSSIQITKSIRESSISLKNVIKILSPDEVSLEYFKSTGFRFPTLVPLGVVSLNLPTKDYTPKLVEELIGISIYSLKNKLMIKKVQTKLLESLMLKNKQIKIGA